MTVTVDGIPLTVRRNIVRFSESDVSVKSRTSV